jgi:hypothetical protein
MKIAVEDGFIQIVSYNFRAKRKMTTELLNFFFPPKQSLLSPTLTAIA